MKRNYKASAENLVRHIIRDCQGAERVYIERGNYVTIRIIYPDDVITYVVDHELYKLYKSYKGDIK